MWFDKLRHTCRTIRACFSTRSRAKSPGECEQSSNLAPEPEDAAFAEAVAAGRSFMLRYPDAMKKLAD